MKRITRKRGIVLIVVLVGIGIAGVLALSVVQLAAAQRQALQTHYQRAQAAWLAESALERAAARLAADAAYHGETWRPAADELGGGQTGVVVIKVDAAKGTVPFSPAMRAWRAENRDSPPSVLISVAAVYPDHPHFRARTTKELIVVLSKGPKS
jgi:Tfp pilus assembly protein PilX